MKPRIGVVGAGTYGSVLINAFYGAHRRGDIDFAAVSDIKPENLDKIKQKYGIKGYQDYKEMLDNENLDGVAVVTPDYLHKEIAIEAAKRGIHILCQKPISTDIAEAKEMVKAARENNVLLYVDFHKRCDPAHIQLKNAIKDGKLGEIEYGYICMEDKILVPTVWFSKWAQNSSPAWFIGIHFYDLLYWLLGEKPVRVYSTGLKKKLISMGIDTYDSLSSKFEFPNGASVTVDASWILPNSFSAIVNQQIRLVGTEGFQEVDSEYRGVTAAYSSDPTNLTINPYGNIQIDDPVAGNIPTGYCIDSMLRFLDLVNRIRNKGVKLEELEGLYPSGEEAVISTTMCQYAHKSAELGKVLDIEY